MWKRNYLFPPFLGKSPEGPTVLPLTKMVPLRPQHPSPFLSALPCQGANRKGGWTPRRNRGEIACVDWTAPVARGRRKALIGLSGAVCLKGRE